MSFHIEAKPGDIADKVLLPGDPQRAEYIASNFLSNVKLYNQKRLMFGFTGDYQGKRVSIQTTGMGLPSLGIYLNELHREFKVQNMVRIGTCGCMQENIQLADIILAQGACTDSGINKRIFHGLDFAPLANSELLFSAQKLLEARQIKYHCGNVLSTDTFYNPCPDEFERWKNYGVLAAEMESSYLYTYAAQNKLKALSILTVSDSILTFEKTSEAMHKKSLDQIIELGLDLI
jgi:purine-nucleoside phosphorylase